MSEHDPAATFRLDQEAAATEQATREEEHHRIHVQQAKATLAQMEGLAAYHRARALLIDTVSRSLALVVVVAVIRTRRPRRG